MADCAGRLAVRVTPGARDEELTIDGGKLLMRVRQLPDSGRANLAVLALLAKALDVAPTQLDLLRGAATREKLVGIPGLPD